MSVIVYDVQKQIMAADTRAYGGDTHPMGNKMKIHRLHDGSLLGLTSSMPGVPEEFKAWLERGGRMDDWGPGDIDLDAILVDWCGDVYLYSNSYYRCGPLVGDVFTVGSGKKYALGAWQALRDPVKAVEVAIACDPMCGGPVAALPLRKPQNEPVEPKEDQGQLPFDLTGFSTGTTLSSSPVAE